MLEKLASQLGRNDEIPNIELAELLVNTKDNKGIKEIVAGLRDKNQALANDCIKVLYEIGERNPALIKNYADDFLALLTVKNNRLVWGGMTALAAIADLAADKIYAGIDKVLLVFHEGSVIAVDNSVTVLAKLCKANKEYEKRLFPLLLQHLGNCRAKEVAQHAERIAVSINQDNVKDFLKVLSTRKEQLTLSQTARINKLESKLSKLL